MNMSKSRQVKLQETKDLLYRHAAEITKDAAHWMNFLDTASRLYRYRFSDVVLIHAQKPEAKSVASYDIWSQNMRRYIKRGTKGIALIGDLWTEPHMRYVYDISDTGTTRLSRSPANWEITDKIEDDMREHMIATYGLEPSLADTFERSLMFTVFQVCEGRGKEILEVMHHRDEASRDGTLLKNLREDMLDGQAVALLSNSLIYILLRRSGIDPMGMLTEDDFTPWLKGLENFELLDAVGNVMMEQAGLILHDMYRTTVQIANENVKKAVDIINKESYTTINKTMRSSEVLRSVVNTPAAYSEGQTAEYNGNGGQEHGHSVYSQRGLPVSESDRDAGSGRESGDWKIRNDAPGVSSDTSVRGLPEPLVHGGSQEALREGERRGDGADGVPHDRADGTLQGSGTGPDDGRLELHGVEEQYREDGGGDRPGGSGVRVVEAEMEIMEDDGLIPEEPDEIPPGLTLPDLPSMSEQIRELQKLEDAMFAGDRHVPVEVIDEFLRHGGPNESSNLRIIYNFMISQTDEEYAEFIREEYTSHYPGYHETYRGLQIDGVPYTARWGDEGFTITSGRSMDGVAKTSLPWAEVSKRTEQLLLAGQYAPQEVLDAARGNAIRENANKLRSYYIDMHTEGRALFSHVDRSLFQESGPDYTKQLREELAKPGFLRDLQLDLQAIEDYDRENPGLIWGGRRWRFWENRPAQIRSLMDRFQKPAIPYQEDSNFEWKSTTSFIPQDVLDDELRRGGSVRGGSYEAFSFFLLHKDKKDRAEFLKEQYGTGGHSGPDFYYVDYDAKGLRISIGLAKEGAVTCSWQKAEARIAVLIGQGTYLTEDQFHKLGSYELNKMAERVASFYQRLPEDIPADYRPAKTGNYAWEVQHTTDAAKSMGYADMLIDEGRGETLYQDMMRAFAALPSDNWNYAGAQQTVQDIRLYLDGKYTMFPGMERMQPSDAVISTEKPAVLEASAVAPENGQAGSEEKQAETGTDSAERKNALAPEDRNEGEILSAHEAETLQAGKGLTSGDQITQKEKLEKKSRNAPKKRKKRDHTDSMRAFHGFPDSVSNGQGQQMSLFDFMSSDGSGFDVMKFATEEQTVLEKVEDAQGQPPKAEGSEEQASANEVADHQSLSEEATDSGANQQPQLENVPKASDVSDTEEQSVLDADVAEERSVLDVAEGNGEEEVSVEAAIEGLQAEEAISEPALEIPSREVDAKDNPFAEDTSTDDVENMITEEEEDLAFVSNLVPGESAFVTAQTHYLIREILFADRVVSAQDMDYAESAGGQIYQTFTFHEVRAIYEQMQSTEAEITETEEEVEQKNTDQEQEPEEITPEKDDGVEVIARYQSSFAMQDGYVENIAILRYPNGMFYNHYGYDEDRNMGVATAGGFETLEDARQTVLAHRPDAIELVARYVSSTVLPDGSLDHINILLLPNGKFYGYLESNSSESEMSFDTLEDAIQEAEELREPDFKKIYQSEIIQGNPERLETLGIEKETDTGEELSADIPGQEAFIQERINYRIADDTLGEGGPKEKFRRNLAAIQTLKQIEAEGRLATAEEQEILAQYVGWGGLPQAFLSSTDVATGKTSTEGAWENEQRQLLEALTPQEYADARESTLTSFYTPPVVIRAMYQALTNFGFTSGNVLEPSCGIGNFMGLVPDTMDVSMYGVELDAAFIFGSTFDARLTLRGSTSTEIKLSSDPGGNIIRIHNALGKFDERIEESERKLAETESMLEAAKENLKKPFEFEEELQAKLARLNELDAELNINQSSSIDAIGVDEDVDTFTAGNEGTLEEETDERDEYDEPSYGSVQRKVSRFGN